MTHDPHVTDRLPAYLDGALDAVTRERVRLHLDACSVCANELAVYRSLEHVLDDDETATPLSPMWPHIARERDPARRRMLDLSFAAAAAAALTAGFMLGVLGFDGSAGRSALPAQTAAAATDDWATSAEPSLSDVYFFENGGTAQ